ncbi:hypothetical protein ACFLSW_04280 [Candidatus Bipolaricaulota bacterium]
MIRAGDPKGLELENADTIYRYENGRFDREDRGQTESKMPSVIDEFLWSLGD